MVSESVLSRGDGTYICREPQALPRHQALVADPAGSDSEGRTCQRHIQPRVSHASLEPAGSKIAAGPPAAARGRDLRDTGLDEYGLAVPDSKRSVRCLGVGD